jgi:hypothetical protein
VPRLALEAVFIILVGIGAALADLSTVLVVLLVLAAWLIVGLGEIVAAASRPSSRRLEPPVATAEPAPYAPAPEADEDTEEAEAVEAPPKPLATPEADAEPEEELEPPVAPVPLPKPRRRLLRRKAEAEPEPQPEPEPVPKHVRVLAATAADPWEQGPELPAADGDAALAADDQPETQEPVADAEPRVEEAAPPAVQLVQAPEQARPARAALRRGRR